MKPKTSRRKKIIKERAEIKEKEKQTGLGGAGGKSVKQKAGSLRRSMKYIKTSSQITWGGGREREKIHITNIRNERENITTDTRDTKRIKKESFDKTNEMDKSLNKYKYLLKKKEII